MVKRCTCKAVNLRRRSITVLVAIRNLQKIFSDELSASNQPVFVVAISDSISPDNYFSSLGRPHVLL